MPLEVWKFEDFICKHVGWLGLLAMTTEYTVEYMIYGPEYRQEEP